MINMEKGTKMEDAIEAHFETYQVAASSKTPVLLLQMKCMTIRKGFEPN